MKNLLAATAVVWLGLVPGQAALAQTANAPTGQGQPGDSAMDLAKNDRQKYLEQGFNMTQKLEFNLDANTGTAKLVGKGRVDMDSDLSHMDPGGGAFVEVYFLIPPDDPAFMRCKELLESNVQKLSVSGHGSYEIGQEVGDPVILRLDSLTKCQ
jgi:hypothetical protein